MSMTSYVIIPIVFLILTTVSSVLVIGVGMFTPILNAQLNAVGAPASYLAAYQGVAQQVTTIGNIYIPLIFLAALLGTLLSTIFLPVNPLTWLISLILLPFIYFILAEIDNVARAILLQPTLTTGVNALPLPLALFANMDQIVIIFAVCYVILLGVRVYFFNPGAQQQGGNSGAQPSQY